MKEKINGFDVIGISVRTTNQDGKAMNDLAMLWNKFTSENIIEKIPNRFEDKIYAIYTDYEGDHTMPYTAIIGCKVRSSDNIPKGMILRSVDTGDYMKFCTNGKLPDAVVMEWQKIWNLKIDREFIADFEVYHETSENSNDPMVDIYIGVRDY
ncbi:MAG: AraC family transcriptional regulator [Desulfobacterales bacterium]|nr:AraC family transcriptional regulator [Desulfobacterales bacterium]MCP4159282.1 AraC family transcriptional regulator [Deltaproteobacteria bacterium]